MKKYLAIGCLMLLGSASFAAQVCTSLENEKMVSYESAQVNFDKSITFSAPKVLVDGQYLRITGNDSSIPGFCLILNKENVNFVYEIANLAMPGVTLFIRDGKSPETNGVQVHALITIEKGNPILISKITCR